MAWNRGANTHGQVPVGANGSGARNKRLIAVAIGMAGVVCAICILAFIFSHEKSPVQETAHTNKKIADARPTAKRMAKPQPVDPEAAKHPGCVLSPAGVWQPTNRPWRANATKVHTVHTNFSKSARNKVPFRNTVEQMLLSTYSCRMGQSPGPYLRIPPKDMQRLVEILISKADIKDDDSEVAIQNKELIARAKKDLADYVRSGGKPENFFKVQHDLLQKAYEKRQAAIREVTRLLTEEGDHTLANDFQNEMNRRFKKEGIMPIHMDIRKEGQNQQ